VAGLSDAGSLRVLALNAGSSTLKASLVAGDRVLETTTRDWTGVDRAAAVGEVLAAFGDAGIDAIAHRVVHGGERFVKHVLLDDAAVAAVAGAMELAPLHNTPAIETIRAARTAFPDRPHVACFDTAFHATLPDEARRYPVPERWHEAGLRRFGFHGLSVEWSLGRAAALLARPAQELRVVVAHLGSGSSVTAVDRGESVWTSMGYTPLDGLMMGTRPGSLDPGLLLRLLRSTTPDRDPETLAAALEHESGLLGVSGLSSDVRELEEAQAAGDERATLALRMFESRAAAGIATAATWLDRLDVVVFTGGIGENAGRIRAAIVGRLATLGIAPIASEESGEDRVIAPGPPALVRVEAREDIVMARAAARLVGS
jgi:acetate kinase